MVVCRVQKLTGQKSAISVRFLLCFSSSIKSVTACLICFSSSQAEPAYCLQFQVKNVSNCFLKGFFKRPEDVITSSVSQKHQCSNSSSPALTYSPLLNEQHSRRSKRLQLNEFDMRSRSYVRIYEWTRIKNVPVKQLHIDKWKNLSEELADQERWHLQCNKALMMRVSEGNSS